MSTIFYYLPLWIQEILLSFYGASVYIKRRFGNYEEYKERVRKNSYLSRQELDAMARGFLASTVTEAILNTKAYKNFEPDLKAKQRPEEILGRIPVTTKRDLIDHPLDYLSGRAGDKKITKVKTTGSTGTPLELVCDLEGRKKNYAFFDWFLELHGGSARDKKITIAGRKIVNYGKERPPFWLCDRFNRTLYMSAYHVGPDTIPSYCRKMVEYRPVYIDSYPSVLYEIAVSAQENALALPKPKFICTSSETLYDYQRQAIESAFGCPVRDQYGAAEMCIFGYECPDGVMHLRQDYSWVEIQPENEKGEVGKGELICTPYLNSATPLLRYKIGDIARVTSKHSCSCGSNHAVISQIEGRRDDVLVGRSGRKYSRLSPVLKGFPIYESQYVLKDEYELVVKIVPSRTLTMKEVGLITDHLSEVFQRDFDVHLKQCVSIPRGPGGKFRAVVNRNSESTGGG